MWRAVALLITISSIAVADKKSADPDPGSFDIEPPLLIPDREGERFGTSKFSSDSAPEPDLAKLEKQFQRAIRNISGLDRLLRMGALSKLEVEQRRLRMIHLESDLANARLIAAKQQMLQKDKQAGAGEIAKADVSPMKTISPWPLKQRMPRCRNASKPKSMRPRPMSSVSKSFSRSGARGNPISPGPSKNSPI